MGLFGNIAELSFGSFIRNLPSNSSVFSSSQANPNNFEHIFCWSIVQFDTNPTEWTTVNWYLLHDSNYTGGNLGSIATDSWGTLQSTGIVENAIPLARTVIRNPAPGKQYVKIFSTRQLDIPIGTRWGIAMENRTDVATSATANVSGLQFAYIIGDTPTPAP